MKKLNRRGYITVEVLLASVIAAAIAIFLIDITVRLVGDTDDAYADTIFTSDKAIIVSRIRNAIKSDIKEYGYIKGISCTENNCSITFSDATSTRKDIKIDDTGIYYDDELIFTIDDRFVSNLKFSTSNSSYGDRDYIIFKIQGENIFAEDKNYDLNIITYNCQDVNLTRKVTFYKNEETDDNLICSSDTEVNGKYSCSTSLGFTALNCNSSCRGLPGIPTVSCGSITGTITSNFARYTFSVDSENVNGELNCIYKCSSLQ